MFEDLTWRCHICGATRPDAQISVLSRKKILPGEIEVQENIRYCNDNPDCREKAKDISFFKVKDEG